MDGKTKLEELVDMVSPHKGWFNVPVSASDIRSISDAFKAMEAENERLRALIAEGDDAHRSIVKETGDTTGAAVWPAFCYSPGSCSRHKQCMYVNCPYEGRPIKAEIEALEDPRHEG